MFKYFLILFVLLFHLSTIRAEVSRCGNAIFADFTVDKGKNALLNLKGTYKGYRQEQKLANGETRLEKEVPHHYLQVGLWSSQVEYGEIPSATIMTWSEGVNDKYNIELIPLHVLNTGEHIKTAEGKWIPVHSDAGEQEYQRKAKRELLEISAAGKVLSIKKVDEHEVGDRIYRKVQVQRYYKDQRRRLNYEVSRSFLMKELDVDQASFVEDMRAMFHFRFNSSIDFIQQTKTYFSQFAN